MYLNKADLKYHFLSILFLAFFPHPAYSKATLAVFMGNLVLQMVFSCAHFTTIIDTNKMVFDAFSFFPFFFFKSWNKN